MDYEVSSNNIKLKSSYEVSKDDFERELLALRERHPESQVWNRSLDSLKWEWAAHNAFHALGLVRRANLTEDMNSDQILTAALKERK